MPEDQNSANQMAKWQHATLEMVDLACMKDLFDNVISAHACDLSDAVYAKLKNLKEDAIERPLLEMLASILGMHETVSAASPFGPLLVLSDGSRSAAPEDFAGPLVEVIVAVHSRVEHPVARARLAHLAWFLERRRKEEGLNALRAYINVLELLHDGRLKAQGEQGILGVTGRDILRVSFGVCRGLGRPTREHEKLREITADLLRQAVAEDDGFSLRMFSDLALDENAMPPEAVSGLAENFIKRVEPVLDDRTAQMWLLIARAHSLSRNESAAHSATIKAAECSSAQAETFVGRPQGALLAAHWMEVAITTLHGIPNVRELRQKLRHRLVDIQGLIQDDLVTTSHNTDITDLVEGMRKQYVDLPLDEALRQFTILPGNSPDPEKLEEEARKSLAQYPLSALFATSHMDAQGKTVARSPGGIVGVDKSSVEILEPTIMRAEGIRRGFAVRANIDVARRTIMAEHRVSEEVLLNLLRHSPCIPPRLVHTVARGFTRWFQGDMVSAIYILTPLLEGILRHLLIHFGHDVTTMDNASMTQEDRTITSLYDAMRAELDVILGRAVTEDIRRVFLSKGGPSLRHGVAHALLSDGSPYSDDATYACWLIWMIAMRPLLPHWDHLSRAG